MTAKKNNKPDAAQQQKGEWLKGYQFKPGQSGNPTGRPKGSGIMSELRKSLDKKKLLSKPLPDGMTARECLGEAMLFHIIKGNAAFLKEVLNRVYGRVTLKIDQKVTSEGGDDISAEVAEAMIAAGLKLIEGQEGQTG